MSSRIGEKLGKKSVNGLENLEKGSEKYPAPERYY
jgi:hypothetical protein